MTPLNAVYFALGSLAGGFARYFVTLGFARTAGEAFPFGTLAVNLAGCFVIGCLSAIPNDRLWLGADGRLMLATGFCGAFTTFSALMNDAGSMTGSGASLRAAGYVAVSLAGGFALYRIGAAAGKLF